MTIRETIAFLVWLDACLVDDSSDDMKRVTSIEMLDAAELIKP